MRAILTRLALAAATVAVSACNGIGEGNTLKSLQIVPASTATQVDRFEAGGTYRLYQCLRDELLLQGTFDDGGVATFNVRATWTSSDEAVVKVSNRDIPVVVISGGEFTEITAQPYLSGTLIPTGNVGEQATITATFAGLSASINVVIRSPQLKIVPVPSAPTLDPFSFSGPASLGLGTQQRLALIGKFDGRVASGIGPGQINSVLNAIRWRFPLPGAYRPVDEDDATVYDNLWVVPDVAEPEATLTGSGTVRGLIAGGGPYEVEASLSLCPDATDPNLKPTTTVQVLPFDATTPISISREAGFHEDGGFAPPMQFADTDIVIGTNHLLKVTGHLDSTGDGIGDVEQNLGQQVRYNFEPKDATCDGIGLNCGSSSLFGILSNDFALTASTGSTGRLNDGFDLVCITNPLDDECDESPSTEDPQADTDPDPVALEACYPICRPRLVSLAADDPVGSQVTLTATTHGISGIPHFVFDCGDGDGLLDTASTPTANCDYDGDTGPFTATVRVLEDEAAVSVNAGAVQISLDAEPVGNTGPTVSLAASPPVAIAPALVFLSATATETNTGDAVTVYEFTPEPGTVIRQSSPVLGWLYLSQPAAAPSVVAYDRYGKASATPATTAVTITGTATEPFRSAPLTFVARPATPCAIRIVPTAADAATEVAFTFPGLVFRAIASFVETKDDNTQTCDDAVIGTQNVSRYLFWAARPEAESTEFSDYVTIRTSASDFQSSGQAQYLANPVADTTVYVTATPDTRFLLKDLDPPAESTLLVQPCPTGTCPAN